MFSEHHVENLLRIVENFIPALQGYLISNLEKQKNQLYQPELVATNDPSIIKKGWEIFIFLMIGYFVYSFLNSIV